MERQVEVGRAVRLPFRAAGPKTTTSAHPGITRTIGGGKKALLPCAPARPHQRVIAAPPSTLPTSDGGVMPGFDVALVQKQRAQLEGCLCPLRALEPVRRTEQPLKAPRRDMRLGPPRSIRLDA